MFGIHEAFKTLELEISSSIEEIEESFKTLSKKYHPDKGGTPEDMYKLIQAKEMALSYVNNRALVKVAREITKMENSEMLKINRHEKQRESLISNSKRKLRARVKIPRDVSGFFTVVSGAVALLVNKLLPIFVISEDSRLFAIMTVLTVTLGLVTLLLNHRRKSHEDALQNLIESLDDRADAYKLGRQVFARVQGRFVEARMLTIEAKHWSEKRPGTNFVKRYLSNLRLRPTPKKLAKLVGPKNFAKLVLSKCFEHEFIEVEEKKRGNSIVEKYKLKYLDHV